MAYYMPRHKMCNIDFYILYGLAHYTKGMGVFRYIALRFRYAKKSWWRKNRILFPSPAEVQFVRVMGGKAIVIDHLKHPQTGFPLTVVTTMGWTLRREYVRREVRVGAMCVDFGFVTPYSKKAIEIDGEDFHRDVVKELQRDEYLRVRGWRVLHIQAVDVYRTPNLVRKRVHNFLAQN